MMQGPFQTTIMHRSFFFSVLIFIVVFIMNRSSFCFSFLVDVHKYGQYLVMLGQTEDAVLLSSY